MRVAIQCMSKACCSGHISHSRNVQSRATRLESKISGTMFFAQWWVLDLTSEPLPPASTRVPVRSTLPVRAMWLLYILLTYLRHGLRPELHRLPVLSTHLCDVTLQSIERSGPLTRTPHHRPRSPRPRFPRGLHASAKKSCQRSEDRTHQPFGFAAESLFD